jgi:hypothetical protein
LSCTEAPETLQKFIDRNPAVLALHNVLGRYASIMYVEAEDTKALMNVLDDNIRELRSFSAGTDTRLVLM